jgi:hypothetical protein
MVATLVPKIEHDVMVWHGGSMESDGRFHVGLFDMTLYSVTVKMFSRLIQFINT